MTARTRRSRCASRAPDAAQFRGVTLCATCYATVLQFFHPRVIRAVTELDPPAAPAPAPRLPWYARVWRWVTRSRR